MTNMIEEIKIEDKKTIVAPERKENNLVDFLLKTPKEIIDTFLTLPDAQLIGKEGDDESFIYIPGTRKDKVLLVAHFDTVWSNKKANPEILYCVEDDKYFCPTKDIGIGADDRAGVAILWEMRESGHSLLLPNAEELGCRGSRFLMKDEKWQEEIRDHQFAIEMDRRGKDDLVFYSVATAAFKDWCKKQFTGFTEAQGSWTDICVLCDEDLHKKNCPDGLNISVGYYNQHCETEHLIGKEWQNTLSSLQKVLNQKDIPSFHHIYQEKKYNNYTNHNNHNSYHGNGYDSGPYGHVGSYNRYDSNKKNILNSDLAEFILCCTNDACNGVMDKTEYKQNGQKCVYCQSPF